MIVFLFLGLLFEPEDAVNRSAPASMIHRYNLDHRHPQAAELPGELGEASGLAVSNDGFLYCHDDEAGIVYRIDHESGRVVSRFSVGAVTLTGDFEGIAVKGDTLFLISSEGVLFRFRAAENGRRVRYSVIKTPLGRANDVEGLEYDPATDCLLIACKGKAGLTKAEWRKFDDGAAVYALPLRTQRLQSEPRFLIPRMGKGAKGRRFCPSGIARHPAKGTFLVISGPSREIVELAPDGTLLARRSIEGEVNRQPEGIAVLPDGTLVLCNEGQGKKGTLVRYPMNP
jgi:uncharacterized protein YjiK